MPTPEAKYDCKIDERPIIIMIENEIYNKENSIRNFEKNKKLVKKI